MTLLAVSRLMPSPPALVEIRNNRSLYQQHHNIRHQITSYHIVDVKLAEPSQSWNKQA